MRNNEKNAVILKLSSPSLLQLLLCNLTSTLCTTDLTQSCARKKQVVHTNAKKTFEEQYKCPNLHWQRMGREQNDNIVAICQRITV